MVIPYQELSGTYNATSPHWSYFDVIPYQELSGNYNLTLSTRTEMRVILYQELPRNQNQKFNNMVICFFKKFLLFKFIILLYKYNVNGE